MSATGAEARVNYLNADYRVRSWLLTTDHKRIAILYMICVTGFFLIGAVFAGIMRLNLLTPQGDLILAETYNKLFTMHGLIMIFFFLIPSIPAVLGNFLIPMMIGARDVAFPRLNLASWYIFVLGGLFTITAALLGGVDTGWTFYTPYSSIYSQSNVVLTVTGIFIVGFSSILTGLNFMVTIHKMRAPGLTWFRLPLFIWGMYATSLIFILGTPSLGPFRAFVADSRPRVTVFEYALQRVTNRGCNLPFFNRHTADVYQEFIRVQVFRTADSASAASGAAPQLVLRVRRKFAQCSDFPHVLSNVEVGFSCDWAASCACSALNAFKKFMLLGELLSVHVAHRFLVNWERKVIKAFSRESIKTNHEDGDCLSWRKNRLRLAFSFVNAAAT